MNKETILKVLEGSLTREQVEAMLPTIEAPVYEKTKMRPPPDTGTAPYTGEWTERQAFHLLNRTTFGPTKDMIAQSVANGMEWTVAKLLEDFDLPEPPLVYLEDRDSVSIGNTWVDSPYNPFIVTERAHRRNSLYSWTMGQLLKSEYSIREKMTLFWHNHFATEVGVVTDAKFIYKYITTLRENALGNFRELCKLMTVDPTILRYLNGRQNTAESPNENFARELLELFSIGKGPQVAEGDYTNYTEKDVFELAKVMTGWQDQGFYDALGTAVGRVFRPGRHDDGVKTLSHRFDNIEIDDMGADEYSHAIDIIFSKDECARFMARKLYRWFVYYEISETEEMNVIEPLAQALVDGDYEMKAILSVLLSSEHFYDPLNCGCIIKSPMDFVIDLFNHFEIALDSSDISIYGVWKAIYDFVAINQQVYYNPPSVAGWSAYYQAPGFNRIWTNGVTLPFRILYTDIMTLFGFANSGIQVNIDFLSYIEQFDNPLNPNELIKESIRLLCPKAMTESQEIFLKTALLPGLPDFEWTEEYGLHLADPSDEGLRMAVENKLKLFFRTLLLHPEYQLS